MFLLGFCVALGCVFLLTLGLTLYKMHKLKKANKKKIKKASDINEEETTIEN